MFENTKEEKLSKHIDEVMREYARLRDELNPIIKKLKKSVDKSCSL